MANTTATNFVEAVRQSRILEPEQLEEVIRHLRVQYPDPRALANLLIKRSWLTPYQVNQLFQGKGSTLVMGQYLILERLGEGGMGQVFKAQQRRLDRIVAVKVIRKERLASADALRRFHREIQAAAQLHHPNIVMAFDANQVGDTHFFVMEYIEGTNLSELLKKYAPPPVTLACDYMKQVALGLQHAHERGMIHRDIKPANLIVSFPTESSSNRLQASQPRAPGGSPWGPVIKILDMGVARLEQTPNDPDAMSKLTKEGRLVGTPDYMAPEQAANSQRADERSDLYSLGCTFHHLLTGQVPFPSGSPMEKLLKHRLDQPAMIEKLRPGVPPVLGAIVRQLMAKRPESRHQSAAELVSALDAVINNFPPAVIMPELTASGKVPQAVPFSDADSTSSTGSSHSLFTSWPFIIGVIVTTFLGLTILGAILVAKLAKPKSTAPRSQATPSLIGGAEFRS